jgi:hypothetical protein
MLSEPNAFGLDEELDLSSLPNLDMSDAGLMDFNAFSTDAVMPSSPPKGSAIGIDFSDAANAWTQWNAEQSAEVTEVAETAETAENEKE